ncbi:MAG: hypothetical protein FE834_01620 [Gammaproteobacteria bacterium]|nr:hypothetical protein [Gammaproteobacteria bacterium]
MASGITQSLVLAPLLHVPTNSWLFLLGVEKVFAVDAVYPDMHLQVLLVFMNSEFLIELLFTSNTQH